MDAKISNHNTDADKVTEVLDKMSGGVVLFLNSEHSGDYLQVTPNTCIDGLDMTFYTQPKEGSDPSAFQGEIEPDAFEALVRAIEASTEWSLRTKDLGY